jgi:putative glycosyltransferase (TIGR04372 family)
MAARCSISRRYMQNRQSEPRSAIRSIIGFVFDQAKKTAARPSRLFYLPFFHFIRILLRVPLLVRLILPLLPRGPAFRVVIGNNLFQQGHSAKALEYFERSQHFAQPSIDEYLVRGLCLYQGLGRCRDAVAMWSRANELALDEVRRLGLGNCHFRVLDSAWARHIGDNAMLDYVIKLGILEGRRLDDAILYLPPGSRVANGFLLNQLAEHLRIVEHPADLPFNPAAVQALHYDMLAPRQPDGTTTFFWEIAAKTYERWHRSGRGPLLRLPAAVEERGWSTLQKAGMRRGNWFVALHMREGRWDGRHAGMHGIRNVDVNSYLPAIAEITQRGGWVVRMGDPNMTSLPPLPNVIDYCHSAYRADWMDLFIAAKCRFMIGTASGPVFVTLLYGTPTLLTNWWPPAQRPWQPSDIFIPKMHRRLTDGSYLTLTESLREPFSYCHSRQYLADCGVQVEDNDPELIRAAAAEMLMRLEGERRGADEVSDLRLRANLIYKDCGVFGMSELPDAFYRHYGEFVR